MPTFNVRAFTDYTVEADSPEHALELYNAAIVPAVGFPDWDVTSDGIEITDPDTPHLDMTPPY